MGIAIATAFLFGGDVRAQETFEWQVPFVKKYVYVCNRAAKPNVLNCIDRWRRDSELGFESCVNACNGALQNDKINLKTYFICEAGCRDRSRLLHNVCLSTFGCQRKYLN